MIHSRQRKAMSIIILVMILLVAGATYFIGNNWGFPLHLHPDEAKIVETAIQMVREKSFTPNHFIWPAHLQVKLNAAVYALVAFFSPMSFSTMLSTHYDLFYLIARGLTSLFSMGCIVLSYLIGRKRNQRTGLFSAFLVAFFPLYQAHSHYATPDMPAVFFMLLMILFSMAYMERPSLKTVVLMSLTAAACIATKYTGAILCGMIAVCVAVSSIRDKRYVRILRHGALAIVLVISFLFLLSPALFMQWESVISALTWLSGTSSAGAVFLGWGGNLLYYFTCFLNEGGLLLLLFFVVGCLAFFRDKTSWSRSMPLFFSLIYWLCLSVMRTHYERWGLPMHVSFFLLAAWGMDAALTFLSVQRAKKGSFKWASYACSFFIGLTALNLITGTCAQLTSFVLPDSRNVALAYCDENSITRSNTLSDTYAPFFPSGGRSAVPTSLTQVDGVYYLSKSRHENVILSSGYYERYLAVSDEYPEGRLYQYILDNFNLSRQFEPASPRPSSPLEGVNIFRNAQYIVNMNQAGFSGPKLLFYKATPANHLPYQWGAAVVFGGDTANYDQYYISGLNVQEPGGCWSAGVETKFLFYALAPEGALSLSFHVTPFLSETNSSQRVRLMANEEEIARWEIAAEGTYTATVPKGIMDDQTLSLRFEYLNITGPDASVQESPEKAPSLLFQEMVLDLVP